VEERKKIVDFRDLFDILGLNKKGHKMNFGKKTNNGLIGCDVLDAPLIWSL
jgi:hypothetical protein